MGHPKDALVDHHHAAAFVAVPAKVRFDHQKFRVRIRAKPLAINGDGFAGDAHHFFAVKFMARQVQTAYPHRSRLADGFAELLTAKNGEIARANRTDFHALPAIAQRRAGSDGAGGADFFFFWQDYGRLENACLVAERLMPGDKWRRLPA